MKENSISKLGFEILFSSLGLILSSPVFLIFAVAIKLDSRGPVFYRGRRVGRYGKMFRIYKFRSMVHNAERLGAASTSSADGRVTGVGRGVRTFKLARFSQVV